MAAVLLSIGSIFWTLAGLSAPAPVGATVTLQDEVQLLLAMGTLALAFAALVQAVGGVDAVRKRNRPGLVLSAGRVYRNSLAVRPGTYAPGSIGLAEVGLFLFVRNLGPGPGKDLRCEWFLFSSETQREQFIKSFGDSVAGLQQVGKPATVAFLDPVQLPDWRIENPEIPDGDLELLCRLSAVDIFDEARTTWPYRVQRRDRRWSVMDMPPQVGLS